MALFLSFFFSRGIDNSNFKEVYLKVDKILNPHKCWLAGDQYEYTIYFHII